MSIFAALLLELTYERGTHAVLPACPRSMLLLKISAIFAALSWFWASTLAASNLNLRLLVSLP